MPASARPSTPSRPSGENRRAVAPHDQRIVSISSRNLIDAVLLPGIHLRVPSETSCSRAHASSRSGQRAFSGGQHHPTQRRRIQKGIAPAPECQAICNSMSSSARSKGPSPATRSIATGASGASCTDSTSAWPVRAAPSSGGSTMARSSPNRCSERSCAASVCRSKRPGSHSSRSARATSSYFSALIRFSVSMRKCG